LRFFHAFSSVVRQMSGYNSQRRGTASTLPKLVFIYVVLLLFVLFCCYLCSSVVICVVLCTVCV
jgi:hypothetical protein